MRLILIRHGETDWNSEYRVQGHCNLPLNSNGLLQAEAIAEALKDEPVEVIYSSPLSRALQTAETINRFHDKEIILDDRLKEMDLGEVDGLYYPSLKTTVPEFFHAWSTAPASVRWPGGESMPELQERIWHAVSGIIAYGYVDSVVLTSHFFSLLALLCSVLSLDLSNFRRLNIGVASISVIEFKEGNARLVSLNDICHLDNA